MTIAKKIAPVAGGNFHNYERETPLAPCVNERLIAKSLVDSGSVPCRHVSTNPIHLDVKRLLGPVIALKRIAEPSRHQGGPEHINFRIAVG
jgi:hypothetical protein